MLELLRVILESISTAVQFLINSITSLIRLFGMIPQFLSMAVRAIGILPGFLIAFATAAISVRIVQYVINRKA